MSRRPATEIIAEEMAKRGPKLSDDLRRRGVGPLAKMLRDAFVAAADYDSGKSTSDFPLWWSANQERIRIALFSLTPPPPAEQDLMWCKRYLALLGSMGWRDIESAPKGHSVPNIMIGYAPDEEGYSQGSKEAWWSTVHQRWAWASDPEYDCPQPTHWMPMPASPEPPRV